MMAAKINMIRLFKLEGTMITHPPVKLKAALLNMSNRISDGIAALFLTLLLNHGYHFENLIMGLTAHEPHAPARLHLHLPETPVQNRRRLTLAPA